MRQDQIQNSTIIILFVNPNARVKDFSLFFEESTVVTLLQLYFLQEDYVENLPTEGRPAISESTIF